MCCVPCLKALISRTVSSMLGTPPSQYLMLPHPSDDYCVPPEVYDDWDVPPKSGSSNLPSPTIWNILILWSVCTGQERESNLFICRDLLTEIETGKCRNILLKYLSFQLKCLFCLNFTYRVIMFIHCLLPAQLLCLFTTFDPHSYHAYSQTFCCNRNLV